MDEARGTTNRSTTYLRWKCQISKFVGVSIACRAALQLQRTNTFPSLLLFPARPLPCRLSSSVIFPCRPRSIPCARTMSIFCQKPDGAGPERALPCWACVLATSTSRLVRCAARISHVSLLASARVLPTLILAAVKSCLLCAGGNATCPKAHPSGSLLVALLSADPFRSLPRPSLP